MWNKVSVLLSKSQVKAKKNQLNEFSVSTPDNSGLILFLPLIHWVDSGKSLSICFSETKICRVGVLVAYLREFYVEELQSTLRIRNTLEMMNGSSLRQMVAAASGLQGVGVDDP